MPIQNYNVIGVMSGTSLDGIDLAQIRLEYSASGWSFEIGVAETAAYEANWVHRLKAAVNFSDGELMQLNTKYTALLGSSIAGFIQKYQLENIDAVCSHGHTVLHQPQNRITLQIGNLPEIAALVKNTVVCDFRVADVALGGQGAPLVPIGDRLLFGDYDYCLNLGGFSNVSFDDRQTRIAFDISAVNTVLNYYANRLGHDYDDRGEISASGNSNALLLADLNSLEYYSAPYPKSLGFEYVQQVLLPLIDGFDISTEDKMRTFSEHIAQQIANALPNKSGKMLVTGGGAYNDFLIGLIRRNLPEMTIEIPDRKILEYKEALIFALLGVLKLRGEVNVLSSVTGASHDHSSGTIYNYD